MHFISTTDLMGLDWQFLATISKNPDLTWETYSGLPRNKLELTLRRPSIARWRAAAEAAWKAKSSGDTVLVSHLPSMAAATNLMRRIICPKTRQIAFAFNFTTLPKGWKRRYFRQALRGIDEFVVHSEFERNLYSEYFDIPKDRFHFLPWAMETPVPGPKSPVQGLLEPQSYICAIGGEGRDYELLGKAMLNLPELPLVIVARPYSIAGLTFPPNVRVFTNLSVPETWRIAADSLALAIPLKTKSTACGHITMVGAQLLGLPLIITRSIGIHDYVADAETALLVTAGDVANMTEAIDRVISGHQDARSMADRARSLAEQRSSLTHWVDYFREYADSDEISAR